MLKFGHPSDQVWNYLRTSHYAKSKLSHLPIRVLGILEKEERMHIEFSWRNFLYTLTLLSKNQADDVNLELRGKNGQFCQLFKMNIPAMPLLFSYWDIFIIVSIIGIHFQDSKIYSKYRMHSWFILKIIFLKSSKKYIQWIKDLNR